MEKKLEVSTDLVPDEYVGYHPLEHYSRNGQKKRGKPNISLPLLTQRV